MLTNIEFYHTICIKSAKLGHLAKYFGGRIAVFKEVCYTFCMNALSISHKVIEEFIKSKSVIIDATAGRGYDTEFLARLNGGDVSVTAFDIQQEAIDSTAKRLEECGLTARLICDSHANMANYFDEGSVDLIVFNLGYLPKGDHSVFTHFESTRQAIESGLKLLKNGGLISVCVYYGGVNGYEERDKLMPYLASLDDEKYQVISLSFLNWKKDPPFPIFIKKN